MTGPCRIGRESRKSTGPLFLTSAVGVQGGFVRALYCLQGRCSEDSSQELVDRTLPLDDGCQTGANNDGEHERRKHHRDFPPGKWRGAPPMVIV